MAAGRELRERVPLVMNFVKCGGRQLQYMCPRSCLADYKPIFGAHELPPKACHQAMEPWCTMFWRTESGELIEWFGECSVYERITTIDVSLGRAVTCRGEHV